MSLRSCCAMLHQFSPVLMGFRGELAEESINKGWRRPLEARRDDFLVELLAPVQKYWPGPQGRPDRR